MSSEIFRCSHQRCSMKKSVLRNSTKFTGKHLCQSIIFNKVSGLRHATLLKKRLWHTFLVLFEQFSRAIFAPISVVYLLSPNIIPLLYCPFDMMLFSSYLSFQTISQYISYLEHLTYNIFPFLPGNNTV